MYFLLFRLRNYLNSLLLTYTYLFHIVNSFLLVITISINRGILNKKYIAKYIYNYFIRCISIVRLRKEKKKNDHLKAFMNRWKKLHEPL